MDEAARARLYADNCQSDIRSPLLNIFIVIVPDEHAEAFLVARRDDIHVGFVANAMLQDRLDLDRVVVAFVPAHSIPSFATRPTRSCRSPSISGQSSVVGLAYW